MEFCWWKIYTFVMNTWSWWISIIIEKIYQFMKRSNFWIKTFLESQRLPQTFLNVWIKINDVINARTQSMIKDRLTILTKRETRKSRKQSSEMWKKVAKLWNEKNRNWMNGNGLSGRKSLSVKGSIHHWNVHFKCTPYIWQVANK